MWLVDCYKKMWLIRLFEEAVNRLFLEGFFPGTTHLCVGQEACAVGVCAALTTEDVIFSHHRGHGHLLARGADPIKLMAELAGRPEGYSQGIGGSQHIAIRELGFWGTHGITGGTIPLAAGVALHKKIHQEKGCAVVFFGDGAVNEGIFHETLNMAAIWHLPLLLICENNGYAMSTPFRQTSPVSSVTVRAMAYNIQTTSIDGNDLQCVYQTTQQAREECIQGHGPFLLELLTYRYLGHSRGDRCTYRTKEEEAFWKTKDPILRLKQILIDTHLWDEEKEANLHTELQNLIDLSIQMIKNSSTYR